MEILFVLCVIIALLWVGFRKLNPFAQGWQESALCKRCGHIEQGWTTKVRGSDKTCPSCGPNSEWECVVSKVHPFWGHYIADKEQSE